MKTQERDRRNRLARLIINKWAIPDQAPDNFWDFGKGEPVDNGGGDTLLLFVLREMSDTAEFGGRASRALQAVRDLLEVARDDLAELDGNLVPYLDGKVPGKELWR